MLEVCISSNVSISYLLLDYIDFSSYVGELDRFFVVENNKFESTISNDRLNMLKEYLLRKIDSELGALKLIVKSPFINYKEFDYKGEKLLLNLHNGREFMLSCLLNFSSIVEYTLGHNGSIFIFNRSFLKGKIHSNVIPLLKINPAYTIQQLIDAIAKLSSENKLIKPTNYEEVANSLLFLKGIGLVDCNKDAVYRLTAKGYMVVT